MKKLILMILLVTGFAAFTKAQDTAAVTKTPQERAAHQTKMMQKKLNLTADQTTQISAILTDRATQMDQGKMDHVKGTKLARMEIMADADKKINAVLTPGQQTLYAQMEQDAKAKQAANRNLHLHQSAPVTAGPPPAQVTPPAQ